MGTRDKPGQFDCLSKALPDEPIFVLLGRDRHGAQAVREWANARELAIKLGLAPESDRTMVEEARVCADQMEAWRKANWPMRKSEAAA